MTRVRRLRSTGRAFDPSGSPRLPGKRSIRFGRRFGVSTLLAAWIGTGCLAAERLNDTVSGKLTYQVGTAKESLTLSSNQHAAYGLVLRDIGLPKMAKKQTDRWLQITVGGKLESVGDLLTLTLATAIPAQPLEVPLLSARRKNHQTLEANTAMALFIPWNASIRDDREKLKNTFLGDGGSVHLIPLGEKTTFKLSSGKSELLFEQTKLRVDIDTRLGNPFGGDPKNLTRALQGTLTTFAYWPANATSAEWMERLSRKEH